MCPHITRSYILVSCTSVTSHQFTIYICYRKLYHNNHVCLKMRETFLDMPTCQYLLYSRVDSYCQAVNRLHLIEPIWLITTTF